MTCAIRVSVLYFFVLLFFIICHSDCFKYELDYYEFPVYSTDKCPSEKTGWNKRSFEFNCTDDFIYMCVPNEKLTELLEGCYIKRNVAIPKGNCVVLRKSNSAVDVYNCCSFHSGCPDSFYYISNIYKYPSCLSIQNGCFRDEPFCKRTQSVRTTDKNLLEETTSHVNDATKDWVWVATAAAIFFGIVAIAFIPWVLHRTKLNMCPYCLHLKKNDDNHGVENEELEPISSNNSENDATTKPVTVTQ